MPTRSGWNTPRSWFFAPAGLVSGPRILKIVRTPSSLSTGAACFIAAWWLGANMKPIEVSAVQSAAALGHRKMWATGDSSPPELPDPQDTLGQQCLATRPPAAAATNIAAV